MGKLAQRKRRARFETGATIFDRRTRPVIVELHNEMMVLRLKGNLRKYALPYDTAYDFAMKRAMLAEATARRLAKKKAGAK